MTTKTLFDGLAKRHPERLVQNLFVYALDTEQGIRALLRKRLGVEGPRALRINVGCDSIRQVLT